MRLNQALFDRALFSLRELLAVTAAERFLVVEDGTLSARLVDAYVAAGRAVGAETVLAAYRSRNAISSREYGVFARASLYDDRALAPEALKGAMSASDVIVFLTSDLEVLFDESFRAIVRGPRRCAWHSYTEEDAFLRLMCESVEEADALQVFTTQVGDVIGRTREVVVESELGTSLRLRIGEHKVNVGTWYGPAGRGEAGVMFWPPGQVSTVPNAGTAEGTLVIDRSVAAPEFRPLLEPIRFEVEQGYVVSVDGGREGRLMARFLEGLDDREAYHLTELGMGTNPRCRLTGVAPHEDTHTLGCVSFALGADNHQGGTTKAGCHTDMTMSAATLVVDGTILVREGAFQVDALSSS